MKPLRGRWQGKLWLSAQALQRCRQHVALPLPGEGQYSLGRQAQMCSSRYCLVPSRYHTQLESRLRHQFVSCRSVKTVNAGENSKGRELVRP